MSKKISFSIYLSKVNTKSRDCFDFEEKKRPTEIHLEQNEEYSLQAYIGKTDPRPPDWFDFIRQYATTPGKGEITKKEGENSSLSGIFVCNVYSLKRCFIFCFGHGKKYLNNEVTEKHFGRNVVLNTAKEKNIMSIRTKSYEGRPWFKEIQSALGANLYEFDIDCQYELLQKVGAELEGVIPKKFIVKDGSKDKELISRKISGYESVNLNMELYPGYLLDLCKWMNQQYISTKYKKLIPNIDVFEAVKEESVINDLNNELIELIRRSEIDRLYLVLPEKHDIELVDCYSISGTLYTEDNKIENLNLNDYVDDLKSSSKLSNVTLSTLKVNKITAFRGSDFFGKWAVYKCLTGEIVKNGSTYALMEGEWYQVESSFYKRIIDKLNAKITKALPLNTFDKNIHSDECGYNKAMSKKNGMELFDRHLQASSLGQDIEPCDLLFKSDKFIHIKRLKSSADLSHLFGQGVVANHLFLTDHLFKSNFLSEVSAPNRAAVKASIDSKKYSVCFGIIIENRKQINPVLEIKNIPIFSILNLSKIVEIIEKVGTQINVEIQLIPFVNSNNPKVIVKKKK